MSGALHLTGQERMSDDAWPGVVAVLPGPWRIAVNVEGTAYRLQQRTVGPDGGPEWAIVGGRSKVPLLVEKFGGRVEGLAEAFARLPDDPAQAVPALPAARRDLVSRIGATSYASDGYGRVLREDGNVRLVVSRDGGDYILQRVDVAEVDLGSFREWRAVKRAPDVGTLRWFMFGVLRDVDADRVDTRSGRRLHVRRVQAFLDGLPFLAVDGDWPPLPEVRRLSDGLRDGSAGD